MCTYYLAENKTNNNERNNKSTDGEKNLGTYLRNISLEQNKCNEIGVRVCGWKIMEFIECLVRDMWFGLCSTNSNPLKVFEQRAV